MPGLIKRLIKLKIIGGTGAIKRFSKFLFDFPFLCGEQPGRVRETRHKM